MSYLKDFYSEPIHYIGKIDDQYYSFVIKKNCYYYCSVILNIDGEATPYDNGLYNKFDIIRMLKNNHIKMTHGPLLYIDYLRELLTLYKKVEEYDPEEFLEDFK